MVIYWVTVPCQFLQIGLVFEHESSLYGNRFVFRFGVSLTRILVPFMHTISKSQIQHNFSFFSIYIRNCFPIREFLDPVSFIIICTTYTLIFSETANSSSKLIKFRT